MEKTLEDLARRRETSAGVFVLLLVIYIIAAIIVSRAAGSGEIVMFGSNPIPMYAIAGVFSAVSNMCLILMVVFCGKAGFITSVILIMIQLPVIVGGIFVLHRYSSIPGIFGIFLTVIAVVFIYRDRIKEKEYLKHIREQATRDVLTGLPNGFASTELARDIIRRGRPFAAVTIDINGFKNINDTMGFDKGNRVLTEIASRFKSIADQSLAGTLDFVSRINGDEFSLIIQDIESEEEAVNTIKQYEAALTEKIHIDGYDFLVNASFGYALYPDDSEDIDPLFSYSVAAMKEIKRINSGEHILRFTPDLLKTRNLLVVDNKIREAIEKDMVGFYLQPQFDMSHRLRGFEALARMKDADGNFVNPEEFIPSAERMGLIDSLDLTVYRKAMAFFGDLLRRSDADIVLCINVSVKHLMKTDFVEEIKGLIEECGVPADRLEIEITESVMIESVEKASGRLNALKDMGIGIAIDDFGTGYSSLSYLNSIPSDILKIDKSFIDIMNTGDSSKKYVEAIISLAHVMDYRVIAEGVEEQAQLETLKSIDCDYIQGFLWGRPLSKEAAEELVLGKQDTPVS
ncbi:MAG: EAL domain-containing protein [Lachnospiraceae bacterium]|nr:EAL domain-containing protein [Lachnospiraceae bacterium]